MNSQKRPQKHIDKVFVKSVLFNAAIVFALLFFSGFVAVNQVVHDSRFADGVCIDGFNVSGMTCDEAEQAVFAESDKLMEDINIRLIYEGSTTALNADDMGISFNVKDVLDTAYGYNKQENDSYEQRYNKSAALSNGMNFETTMMVDQSTLRETVEKYAAQYYKDAADAAAFFDHDTCVFTYSNERYGTQIDTDDLVNKITEMLYDNEYSTVQVSSDVIYPDVKLSDLKQNTVLIAASETTASNNQNRNINIQLMCDAVDGMEIKPGEILSINALTGERTAQKGFKAAPAIIHGVLVDDIGGGICQLAGTLYNAVLLTDLEIVERIRHTWPSNYLPIGQDATLNWNDKDLKIKNTSDYSVFISAKFEDQKVSVKLYGQPLEDNMTIEIQNDIIEKISPADTEIRYTSELPSGARETVRYAREGYKVKVYRIFLKDGAEIDRELISSDIYPAINKLVLIGSNTQDK